ncbi:hypothetical protein Poly51_54800 [Rubripirellula tenax]|uniref:Uncharacterized protein n=1 Tax=Rubripirellula tenax TaxID=2528015 RepID=A0A5C6EC81_9BACT|nr:hypothetical protein [Rubripirellula tenax]TWU46085.1 hypothetical protein Poly51_54800 [Rubripirellula tenax]
MRKEVKRSLLLWPAAASATITAAAWIGIQVPVYQSLHPTTASQAPAQSMASVRVAAFRQSVAAWTKSAKRSASKPSGKCLSSASLSSADITPLEPTGPSTQPSANLMSLSSGSLADRSEYGSRGVRLPARVASVFGEGERLFLLAPVRDPKQELAGLARQLHDEAASRFDVASGTCIVSDVPMSTRTLQSLRNRSRVIQTAPVEANAVGSVEETVGADTFELTPAAIKPNAITVATPVAEKPQPKVAARKSSLPESNRVLAKPARIEKPVLETLFAGDEEEQSYVTDLPQIKMSVRSDQLTKKSASDWPAGWPVTSQLDNQLQSLTASTVDPQIADWSQQVQSALGQLRSLHRLGDAEAGDVLAELDLVARSGEIAAERLDDRDQQTKWLQAVHALNRRLRVWRPVWEVTRNSQSTWMVSDQVSDAKPASVSTEEVLAAVEIVRNELTETGDEDGWAAYLLLDEIQTAANSQFREVARREERSIVAQRLLSRLSWHALQEDHLQWLDRASVRTLASVIRPWARGAVDYADLMDQIERQESDALDMAAIEIADAVQTLRYADNPQAVEIASSLESYYRNANVRIAISQTMLNRMLPTIDPKSVPLNTTMLGTRVRGTSDISSNLAIQLTPAADRWAMQLQTLGNVTTRSTGFNGPVALRTTGSSSFVAATPIEVSSDGVRTGNVSVDVQGNTRLRGVRSDYDSWPLVGTLVRSIAESRYDQASPMSNRLANRKIKTEVSSEIQTRLNEQVGAASAQLSSLVLGPLGKLQLDPQVIDMQTTNERLLARYRLAGDWQLAAFTPRPRAPQSSLMSLQVHQSAINNTLEQLVPRDKPTAIEEVLSQAATLFGQELTMPDDMPEGVTIQFARTRPITVEIEDGQLWVTMRIVRLNQGSRVDLTQFIVRAAFTPQVNGLEASLVREGHLRISGPGMSMRERLPVRAIFNKVLAQSRPLPLTLPMMTQHPSMKGLAVSQLELRGGWIGMAFSEATAPRIALQTLGTDR